MSYARRSLAFAAVLAAAAIAACSKPDGIICPALAFAGPQLLSPIPGSTGVPTLAGTLLVAGTLVTSATAELVPSSAGVASIPLVFGPPPSPLPSPAATPFAPSVPLAGLAYPQLASQTTYTLSYRPPPGPCAAPIAPGGSFTTR